MFKVVGKGVFTRDDLMSKLQEWGIVEDPQIVIKTTIKEKRCACGGLRILLVM